MRRMESRCAEFSNFLFGSERPMETIRKANNIDFKIFWEWHFENSKIGALSTREVFRSILHM